MKKHLGHLAMCAPMIIVAAILIATGSGIGILFPLAACMLMMAVMMGGMGGMDHGGHDDQTGHQHRS